jgi:uncharacterized protein YcaQ
MPLRISNRDARRLWLDAQELSAAPTGPLDVRGLVRRLGYVQLDTIQVVSRAHHHILWSRNQNYREPMLNRLLQQERGVFEHFTHDASVLPIETYPMWRRRFVQLEEKVRSWEWHRNILDEAARHAIRERIRQEGPLSTHAFESGANGKEKKPKATQEMWRRPPHKLALDYMWYAGHLSTSHRENFTKFYDLTERVIPERYRNDERPDHEQVDWLCREALARLAFGTEGEIMRFWQAASLAEVKAWSAANAKNLVPVEVETHDGGWFPSLAPTDIEQRLASAPAPTSRLRILNPFDPAIRDRNRLLRLFGFDYTIEIFVPAAKRRWGYYVYPLLEGDRFVGRIELKADRNAGTLSFDRLWVEDGVKWTGPRETKLAAELDRMARFIGVGDVIWNAS